MIRAYVKQSLFFNKKAEYNSFTATTVFLETKNKFDLKDIWEMEQHHKVPHYELQRNFE